MIDFNIDLNFDEIGEATSAALVLKQKSKKRKLFKIEDERRQLEATIGTLPTKDEEFKMISAKGGFSSIGIIDFVARKEKIVDLYVSTFRIGLKQFEILTKLNQWEYLDKASFITSGMQGKNGENYDYLTPVLDGCKNQNWRIVEFNNHSKIILMKTPKNSYVVETSSNLNENPKIEQFNFFNDAKVFAWYKEFFEAVFENVEY